MGGIHAPVHFGSGLIWEGATMNREWTYTVGTHTYRANLYAVCVEGNPVCWIIQFSTRTGYGGSGRRVSVGKPGRDLEALLTGACCGTTPGWALADALQDNGMDDDGVLMTIRHGIGICYEIGEL